MNMPWFSYNNILIIVNNATKLVFLSTRLVHPGALQLTVLSFLTLVIT